ncbi:MAG: kelch repeat-containing protein [Candidatus Nanopelagicales bacterium]
MKQRRIIWGIAATSLAIGACGTGTGTPDSSGSPASPSVTPSATASAGAASCPSGSAPDTPGPADQDRPQLGTTAAAQDRASGKVVVGEVRAVEDAGLGTLQATWTFDVCTNTWQRMNPTMVASSPTAGKGSVAIAQFVHHGTSGLTLGLPVGLTPVWTYSLKEDVWTELPSSRAGAEHSPHSVFDPGRSLLFDWDGQSVLRSYDLSANEWSAAVGEDEKGPSQSPAEASWLSFDAAEGVAVLTISPTGPAKAGRTWTFDSGTRAWTEESAAPKELSVGGIGGPEVAFDAGQARTVIFTDGVLATYDAAADDWAVVKPGPGWPQTSTVDDKSVGPLARTGHTLVYDALNERVLMFGGVARMADGDDVTEQQLDDVWAYDLADNKWTELVAARTPARTIQPG